ncbi:MAG TPA: hypothetical protein VJ327_01870 [Patescibacteria group bacterium]|nr:MAG: hypothetical protein UX14_C0023G0003 [Parcubacteria group bacterium GW2011_GWF1_45_5]HJZ04593.1 hypothetical protein [Patescibacteria group bacterium]
MLATCPHSGLILPRDFIDEKEALKKLVDKYVEEVVNACKHLDRTYYVVFHGKFDQAGSGEFHISRPVVTHKLPPFMTNQIVFVVNNKKEICELLWVVPARGADKKLKVDFNTKGAAYLQAKGALPRVTN